MKIKMIAAVDANWGIGREGELLFHDYLDMLFFKRTTENNIVVMGKNTWNSLPDKSRPLPNRTNIIITDNPHNLKPGNIDGVVGSTILSQDSARQWFEFLYQIGLTDIKDDKPDIYIIGGGRVYKDFEKYASEILINKFHESRDADTFIRNFDEAEEFERFDNDKISDRFDSYIYKRKKMR